MEGLFDESSTAQYTHTKARDKFSIERVLWAVGNKTNIQNCQTDYKQINREGIDTTSFCWGNYMNNRLLVFMCVTNPVINNMMFYIRKIR